MPNGRLRASIKTAGYARETFAEELGVDPKTVERWITKGRVPHRNTATRAAKLLEVSATWLWPPLDDGKLREGASEVLAFFPHRSDAPKHVWLDLLIGATTQIDLMAYASLFLPEENPESINILRVKAAQGIPVRIALGDPDKPEIALRGREERLYDAIPARIRMALAYYRPLVGASGISFHLHTTTLYNSIFRFDNQMLINQHVYGTYGYMAPLLHLRQQEGADLFSTYERSFERVWEESYPFTPPAP